MTETVRQEKTSMDALGFEPWNDCLADECSTVVPRGPEVFGSKKYGCV